MIINFNFGNTFDLWHEFVEFFKIGISVYLTGLIGWNAYLKQQRNERLKQDLLNFTLIFYSIQNNITYASAFLEKAQSDIKELNKNISILKNLNTYADNINSLNSESFLSEAEIVKLKNYKSLASKACQNLIYKTSFIKIIGELSINNYEKEALFLTNYGDVYFQGIYTCLAKEYVKSNLIIDFINETIDRISNKATIRNAEVNICDISQEGYEISINRNIQENLFILNLYEQLKHSSEKIIFYSDIAFNHLLEFNSKLHNKYKKVYKSLGLSSYEIKIDKDYHIEDLAYYCKNKEIYEKLNKLPKFRTLELSLFEKFWQKATSKKRQL